MTKVVFTGPAYDAADNPILRADLKKVAQKAGYTVLDHFCCGTQLLVASRLDTVKARKAAEQNIEVISYPEFLDRLTQQGAPKPTLANESKAEANGWVDDAPEVDKARRRRKPAEQWDTL
jgi:Fe-S oxidoreductase